MVNTHSTTGSKALCGKGIASNQCKTRCAVKHSCWHSVCGALPSTSAIQDVQHNVPTQPTKLKREQGRRAEQRGIQKARGRAKLSLAICSKRRPRDTKVGPRSAWATQNWGQEGQVDPKLLPTSPKWRPGGAQGNLNRGQEAPREKAIWAQANINYHSRLSVITIL